ncbi:hypothetical protein BJY01DRAFT_262074 [Aspergillus pseudoustus]|uniref:Rhodopsin domain-containing protein n=1 Tax=Aspergillus pseudoustus TaxID=1810923 RepID=A0ABR4IK54_9EURO
MTHSSLPLIDRSLAVFAVSAVMLGLSVVAVALRCVVRVYLIRAFGWDDAVMVAALALFSALASAYMIGPIEGIGHTFTDFKDVHSLEKAMKWWWLGQILYVCASAVAKVAIALALLRLAGQPVYRVILQAVITVTVVSGLVFFCVLLFGCWPISYWWHRVDHMRTGRCLSGGVITGVGYLFSAITIVCDIALGILPALMIWWLQMTRRTKIAVGGILSLGAVASIAAIIRLPYLKHCYCRQDQTKKFISPDSTYQIAIWSIMETGLAIVAGSLITLRPLLRLLLDQSLYQPRLHHNGTNLRLYTLRGDASEPSHTRDPRYGLSNILPDLQRNGNSASISSHLGQSNVDTSQEDLNPKVELRGSHRATRNKTFLIGDGES